MCGEEESCRVQNGQPQCQQVCQVSKFSVGITDDRLYMLYARP